MNPFLVPQHPTAWSPLSTNEQFIQRKEPRCAPNRSKHPRPFAAVLSALDAVATFAIPVFRRRLSAVRRNLPSMVERSPKGMVLTCLAVGWIVGRSLTGGLHR